MHYNKFKIFLIAAICFLFFPGTQVQAANNLSGKILLQTQDRGQAWYVSPSNQQRYPLKADATSFLVLSRLGLGISNRDFNALQKSTPTRLLGRILIKVEDKGKAFYLDPKSKKLYPLNKPADITSIIKNTGLGISNANLAKIPAAQNNLIVAKPKTETLTPPASNLADDQKEIIFTWKYKNKDYSLKQTLSNSLYKKYTELPKSFVYSSNNPPANPRDSFYKMLISTTSGDTYLDKLLNDLKSLAAKEGYKQDQLVEFVMAFVQYIPYDQAKAAKNEGIANYPYETIYKNTGVCSDKSFLSSLLLRKLGYGTIIFDFPDANHSAVGIQCPINDSSYQSGYCYAETTNYFPIGVLPQSLDSGIANSNNQLIQAFNTSSLGKVEYYQKTNGLLYNGLGNTKNLINYIKSLEISINNAKTELSALQTEIATTENKVLNLRTQLENYQNNGNFFSYNSFLPTYNAAVTTYNEKLASYQIKAEAYNSDVAKYNQAQKDLFQK